MVGGLIHCFLYYGAIRYVTSKHKPFGSNLAQLGCYLLASLGIDIGEGDTSALFSHAQRRCCSNTSPGSSDESNSSVKSSHASVSFLFSYKICIHKHKGFDKPPIETVYHIEQVLFSQCQRVAGLFKSRLLPLPTPGKGEKVGTPHIPPRGCRPLDPCFAQLLNGPERVASRQVTPCGPTSALWRIRAGKIMQSPGARSIFLVLSG